MKIYIITYKESTTIDDCVERYKELGYNPIIFMGKSIKDDNIPFNTISYINYLDLFNSISNNIGDDDICISEDDVYLKEKIIIKDKNQINWLGYWNVTKSFIMGCMLLYYPKEYLQHVKRQLNAKQPQHLDGFLHKYLDYILRPTTICLEIKHHSVILEEFTKGKKTIRNHKYIK